MATRSRDPETDGRVSFFNLIDEIEKLAKDANKLKRRMVQYRAENSKRNGDFVGHPPRQPQGSFP